MTTRELLQMALTALERGIEFVPAGYGIERQQWETIEAIHAHLEKPEPEPVAWWDEKIGVMDEKHFDQMTPLYRKEQL
jgi:hypothetical protein